MNRQTSLSDNLFRDEVQDDIVFDLDTKFSNSSPIISNPKIEEIDVNSTAFKMPDFQGIDLRSDKNKKESQPEEEGEDDPFSLNLPDIPKIDLSQPTPDFQPAIDKAKEILEPVVDPVADVGEAAFDFTKKGVMTTAEVMQDASEPVLELVNESVEKIKDVVSDKGLENVLIKQGTGEEYGEVAIGTTGAVLDVSKDLDNSLNYVLQGTEFEGVQGRDLFAMASNPKDFVIKNGIEKSTAFLSENLNFDKNTSTNLIKAIANPSEFIKDIPNLGKSTSISSNIAKMPEINSSTTFMFNGFASAVKDGLLSGGDVHEVANNIGKKASDTVVVQIAATAADAIIPGAGTAIRTIAQVFNYSCYLSTASYYHGFINKRDFLLFTKYRLRVQSNERFADKIWLGYIELFDSIYNKMITSKKLTKAIHVTLTAPFLGHLKYIFNKEKFNLFNYITYKFIQLTSLISYFVFHKKAQIRYNKIKDINIVSIYRNIIKEIDKR